MISNNALAGLTLAIVAMAAPTAAQAQPRTLTALGGADVVFVWIDADAHGEAMRLISAGTHRTNPTLLYPLLACIVPAGTQAVITNAGFMTHDITIVSGEKAGCRGNVAAETLSKASAK